MSEKLLVNYRFWNVTFEKYEMTNVSSYNFQIFVRKKKCSFWIFFFFTKSIFGVSHLVCQISFMLFIFWVTIELTSHAKFKSTVSIMLFKCISSPMGNIYA